MATAPREDSVNKMLVTAVEAIYAAALDPLLWPTALAAAADCVGDPGAILLWRCDDGSFDSIVSKSLLGGQKHWQLEGWNVKDSRPLSAADRSYFFSGFPFTEKHLFSDQQKHTISSCTQFLVRHGLGSFAAVGVSPDPHVGVVLGVVRNARGAPHSDNELATVTSLGRHVQKSLRLSVRQLNSELQNVGLGDALSRVGIGVFIVDSSGQVLFVNQVGHSLLGGGLMSLGHGRLLLGTGTESRALEVAIKAIRRSPGIAVRQKPIVVRCPETDQPLAIYVLPVTPSAHPVAQFDLSAHAMILAIGPREVSDPALIRDVLGLTLGEARLASYIGSGLAPREAAEKLGITEETARTVLKHVFSKTGVSRQSELVSLLSRMVLHQGYPAT